ncbi:MAG UNVERIFIED_CONTAM: hypothetical protein LVR18_18010 [Planctomycetaceae bacterium]|jgi:ATP-dependent DNA helicase RecG
MQCPKKSSLKITVPCGHQLASLRLFDLKSDCPTNAGVLVLADRPMHFLPGAYVQFVRYAGADEASDVIAEKRAVGDLRSLLQTLDLLTEVNIRSWPVEVSPLREMMRFDYPKVALREFLNNAVMHRNYQSTAPIRWLWFSNHIRIASPGGLWGEREPKTFPVRWPIATRYSQRPFARWVLQIVLEWVFRERCGHWK